MIELLLYFIGRTMYLLGCILLGVLFWEFVLKKIRNYVEELRERKSEEQMDDRRRD